MRIVLSLLLASAVIACAPVSDRARLDGDSRVLLARSGLILEQPGSDRLIGFGEPINLVEMTLAPVLGPVLSRDSGITCPGGIVTAVRFDDVTLFAEGIEFSGWTATGDDRLRTDAGVGIGSSIGDVQNAYGMGMAMADGFSADGFSGAYRLGRVSSINAGRACAPL
ncbi:hypothetical protein [Roseobacter sp. HKCCA0434]|uniref:hypothetical protein n=1 Tax=Roseobacter sp. HKCCA0434 TaxID=3079297 RepID=UPI0029059A85|nr:hypothetical protein [Roseobacter sp. HKCCA0434]